MSVIWGVLKDRGATVGDLEVLLLGSATQRFAATQGIARIQGRIGMGLRSVPTHARASMEVGPVVDVGGNIVSFDGRLDNFRELADLLGLNELETSDSTIALAAFLRWGEGCFARFTGDWALSLWCIREQKLLLARDHAGTRSLYFHPGPAGTFWSTYLETFLSGSGELSLSEEYAASYISCLPIRDSTPYENIRGVKPGHFVALQNGTVRQCAHWEPLFGTSIRYKSDEEYDEHFMALFEQSVAYRTGSGAKILAQLSGGMDSTSIVCMSDYLRRRSNPNAEILDTISFFDDTEVSLNERAYFTITENQRGKRGIHLNAALVQHSFDPPYAEEGVYSLPGADNFSVMKDRKLFELIWKEGYRAILSGVGGDEVLGGVPLPSPELSAHLASGNLGKFFRQSLAWCLTDRTPLISSIAETIRYTLLLYTNGSLHRRGIPPWLTPKLAAVVKRSDSRAKGLVKNIGAQPDRLGNTATWWSVMETLPHLSPHLLFRPEYRYPMLDKNLIAFLFSIPREVLVKPGRRRALMRRSLKSIVPDEILERRRKAFQLRSPLKAIQVAHDKLDRAWDTSLLAGMNWIDVESLRKETASCANGTSEWRDALLRTIAYELWLRARSSEDQSMCLRPRAG